MAGIFWRQPYINTDTTIPVVSLPERQFICSDPSQRSIHPENYACQLKDFTDSLYSIPTKCWTQIPVTHVSISPRYKHKLSDRSTRLYKYKAEYVIGGSGGVFFLVEYDCEDATDDEAFDYAKRMYHAKDYLDDQSSCGKYFPIKLKNPNLVSAKVVQTLWDRRPSKLMTEREWVEFEFADIETKSIINRSTLHPELPEYNWNKLKTLIGTFLPTGSIRAMSYNCFRFCPPRPGRNGCHIRLLSWNLMFGYLDPMVSLLKPVENVFAGEFLNQLYRTEEGCKIERDTQTKMPEFIPNFCS